MDKRKFTLWNRISAAFVLVAYRLFLGLRGIHSVII